MVFFVTIKNIKISRMFFIVSETRHFTTYICRRKQNDTYMLKGWSHKSFSLLAARLVREGILPVFLTFLVAPAFVLGCTDVTEGEDVLTDIHIVLDSHSSKAPSWWLVKRLDIFIFNADNGVLDSWQTHSGHISTGVTAQSGHGPRIIAAIANMETSPEILASIRSYDDLKNIEAELANDSPEYPIMSGTASYESGSDRECTITLTPVLCEISLSLKCRFGGEWKGAEMKDVQVFLTGVSGRTALTAGSPSLPTEILNIGGLLEFDLQRLAVPRMLCVPLGDIKSTDGSSRVYASLYAYPNNTKTESLGSPFTRIVIEGKVNGEVWYYPIPLKDLQRNTYYSIDITITQAGSKEPFTDVSQ